MELILLTRGNRTWRTLDNYRYIFAGISQFDLSGSFRISPASIGRIINNTSIAIWNTLLEQNLVKAPSSEEECKSITLGFEKKQNFHYCIGAIDGKYVNKQAPARSGSYFFNYNIALSRKCQEKVELSSTLSTDRSHETGHNFPPRKQVRERIAHAHVIYFPFRSCPVSKKCRVEIHLQTT